ncbi:UNVERIFIED_CONTAM: energy-coupling factor transport system substrate-specific component [Brevibacillus sp. OAP136]
MNVAMLTLVLLLSLSAILLLLFEKSRMDEKVIAVTATLGAVAAIARIPFSVIPNVQPTTFLVMLTGYVFGLRVGFLTGVIAAVLSNMYLGQGPWTIWQMFAWGLSGVSGGLLSRFFESKKSRGAGQLLATRGRRFLFIAVCTIWGFLFDWIMNFWMFLGLGFLSWQSFVALNVKSLAFDIAHSVGNFIFASMFATAFAKIFVRYHQKLIVTRLFSKEGSG